MTESVLIPKVVDKSLDSVPPAYELILELMKGARQVDLAVKYNCSKQNINQKIQTLITQFDPDKHTEYLINNVPILKQIEAYHILESVNPKKTKKMNAYQHTGMGKLIWEMRRTEEGKATEITANMSLIADVNQLLEQLKSAK